MNKDCPLARYYEEIRSINLGSQQIGRRWGMAVLRTYGMAVWVGKWHEYDQHTEATSPAPPPGSNLPANSEEIVMLLAAMVGAIYKEEL